MDLPVQQFRTKAEQAYLDLFEEAEKALPGAREPFVSKLRAEAIETYGRLGLPHRRQQRQGSFAHRCGRRPAARRRTLRHRLSARRPTLDGGP